MNYYNDNDKGAVKWIKYLIKNKLIPDGEVDDRSIKDVNSNDLRGFIQCHFFAGICGWSNALQLAAWPDNKPVWTGSCPCQPFSVAGQGKAEKDDRHLWPYFRQLIKESNPKYVFGEQVASKLGREWLAGVQTDMERMGFTFGASDIPACSVGAPHIRQRLWWVAHANGINGNRKGYGPGDDGREREEKREISRFENNGVANAQGKRQHGAAGMPEQNRGGESETSCGLGNAKSDGSQERKRNGKIISEKIDQGQRRTIVISGNDDTRPWGNYITASCRDGKRRRISTEPKIFPLAYGLSGRVALLRGIGNSIVPQVAAEFIRAFVDYENI